MAATDKDAADIDDGVFDLEFATDELERLQHRDGTLDPGKASQGSCWIAVLSPTAPMTVRCLPSDTCASAPIASSRSIT